MKPVDEWKSSETSEAWKRFKGRGIKTKEDLSLYRQIEKRHLSLTGFALPKVHISKELL